MRYEAPDSRWKGRSPCWPGATGETRILAGGTDLLVQMRADVVDPDLIVDIKKIAETRADHRGKGRLAHRRRGDRRRAEGASPAQAGLAGRDRGGQPHRLDPGAGARDARRQPVQRLAGRRQRARRSSPRAPSPRWPGPKGRRDLPVEDVMLGPRKLALAQGGVRRLLPAAAAPAALERRLPALHPAHRDGHRGGRRGREPHRRRGGHDHRGARVAGRGGRAGVAGGRGRRRPSSAAAWTGRAGPAAKPRRARRARRSTTSEERSNSASRSPAC